MSQQLFIMNYTCWQQTAIISQDTLGSEDWMQWTNAVTWPCSHCTPSKGRKKTTDNKYQLDQIKPAWNLSSLTVNSQPQTPAPHTQQMKPALSQSVSHSVNYEPQSHPFLFHLICSVLSFLWLGPRTCQPPLQQNAGNSENSNNEKKYLSKNFQRFI